jgi:hypothetical protein
VWVEAVLRRSLCWLSGLIEMETVFSQLAVILRGNQVQFSAEKPVFIPCGFDVRSLRVRVQWAAELDCTGHHKASHKTPSPAEG